MQDENITHLSVPTVQADLTTGEHTPTVVSHDEPQRQFNVPLADRPMPDFAAFATRKKYDFDQIKVGHYVRYEHKPKTPEAIKIKAAANSWARKNVGRPVFSFEDEADAICVWRVA